jgi:hypothetical protein
LPDEPEPSDLDEAYRDLAARYAEVARALEGEEASTETSDSELEWRERIPWDSRHGHGRRSTNGARSRSILRSTVDRWI